MKLLSCLVFLFFVSCSSAPKFSKPTGSGEKISGAVNIPASIDYKYVEAIPKKITSECTALNSKLSNSTKIHGKKMGVDFVQVKAVSPKGKGNRVHVDIINAVSSGNAFIGHNKSMTIHAYLYAGNTLVDDVELKRSSGGGFGAGFKSSCDVLERVTHKLGEDIATWVRRFY